MAGEVQSLALKFDFSNLFNALRPGHTALRTLAIYNGGQRRPDAHQPGAFAARKKKRPTGPLTENEVTNPGRT
jgi:hypothetical protein